MVHMKNGREVYPSSMALESFKVTMGTEIGVDEYSSSETYAVGDYCIYTNTIYKCKTAITTPEAFNSSKWDATSIANELMSTKQSLSLKLIAQEIPYSNFTFDSTNNCFIWTNPTFTGIIPLFFVAYATNGGAILSVTDRRTSSPSRLSVEGWVPNTASKITSAFKFKCYAVGLPA